MKKNITLLLLCVLNILFFSEEVYAEGTKQLTTDTSQVTSMYIWPSRGWGPYFGGGEDDKLRFCISDHTTENFYFGAQFQFRGSATNLTDVHYRILDETGAVVAGPAQFPTSGNGWIDNFSQSINGPNINGTTTGYDPITFDPTANGEYHIEIYRSTNNGASQTSTVGFIAPIYDFTVAGSTTIEGRIYCRAWSILATTPTDNFQGQFIQPVDPVFFTYTPDSLIMKVTFNDFNPLAAIIGFNFFGVDASEPNWTISRQSVYSDTSGPNLSTGYPVFLTQPDPVKFPVSSPPTPPTVSSDVLGCPLNYRIPFCVGQSGDVFINLDLNGVPGFQEGTEDRQLLQQNVSAGCDTLLWDGLDGLGNTVLPNATITITTRLSRGRVNFPVYDAEWNINGFTMEAIAPVANPNVILYWDDSGLGSVGNAGNQSANVTGTGIDNSVVGQVNPARSWNGPYGTSLISAPAPANGGGNSSPANAWDDWGNVRTLNTWFFVADTTSIELQITLPPCAPLPVTGMQLSGKRLVHDNVLNLTTLSELNTSHFILERSFDNKFFKNIATLKAAGTSDSKKVYSYLDADVSENSFYRFQQVDIDGKASISNTILIQSKDLTNNGLVISPNPVQNQFKIEFIEKVGFYKIKLFNTMGGLITNTTIDVNEDYMSLSIDRKDLPKGIYLLRIENEENNQVEVHTLTFE